MHDAGKALPQDRWRHDAALQRLYSAQGHLLAKEGDAGVPLAALCLAVPLVHEAILAGLVLRLAEAGAVLYPGSADAAPGAAGLAARAWRESLAREEDIARRRA